MASSFALISAAEMLSPSRRRTLSPLGKSFHSCKSLAVKTIAGLASFLSLPQKVKDQYSLIKDQFLQHNHEITSLIQLDRLQHKTS